MKSFTIILYGQRATRVAMSPRQALKLAVDARQISQAAWRWMGDATQEGYYGPLSITRNTMTNQQELF